MLITASLTLLALLGSVILTLSGKGSPLATAHLAFAAGIVPLIMAAMIHFVPVLTRSGDPDRRILAVPHVAQAAGLCIALAMQGILPYAALYGFALLDAALVIILSRSWDSPLTKLFALIGKTSFSAYVFHLIVGALVFYVLGFFEKFSFSILFFFALTTYLLAAATCWGLQREYRSGPFEMLMKRMTYGKHEHA